MRCVAAVGEEQFVFGAVEEDCQQSIVLDLEIRIDREFAGGKIANSDVVNAFFAIIVAGDQEDALAAIHEATMTFPVALGFGDRKTLSLLESWHVPCVDGSAVVGMQQITIRAKPDARGRAFQLPRCNLELIRATH